LVRAVPQVGAEGKWRIVGDKAMDAWRMDLAEECYGKAGDLAALLLIYTSMGDRAGLEKLAQSACE
jgi:coatomer subunit beta'